MCKVKLKKALVTTSYVAFLLQDNFWTRWNFIKGILKKFSSLFFYVCFFNLITFMVQERLFYVLVDSQIFATWDVMLRLSKYNKNICWYNLKKLLLQKLSREMLGDVFSHTILTYFKTWKLVPGVFLMTSEQGNVMNIQYFLHSSKKKKKKKKKR